jgi:hypothetical protein
VLTTGQRHMLSLQRTLPTTQEEFRWLSTLSAGHGTYAAHADSYGT